MEKMTPNTPNVQVTDLRAKFQKKISESIAP